jgi:hypothetical protein
MDLEVLYSTDRAFISAITSLCADPSAYEGKQTISRDMGRSSIAERVRLQGSEVSVMLKRNRAGTSDSLVYEYLVGLSINELAEYYPCFPRTYMIAADPGMQNLAAEYTADPSTSALSDLVALGCKMNERLCLAIQYMPVCDTLHSFLKRAAAATGAVQVGLVHSLIAMLHVLYMTLSSVAGSFTHYDLHTENVGVVEIPDGAVLLTIVLGFTRAPRAASFGRFI